METGLSCFKHNFAGDEYDFACNLRDLGQFFNAYKDHMQYWKDTLPNAFYEVRYEKLVDNFEMEAKKLLDYCELRPEADCFNIQRNRRLVTTASSSQVRKGVYRNPSNRAMQYGSRLQPLRKLIAPDL